MSTKEELKNELEYSIKSNDDWRGLMRIICKITGIKNKIKISMDLLNEIKQKIKQNYPEKQQKISIVLNYLLPRNRHQYNKVCEFLNNKSCILTEDFYNKLEALTLLDGRLDKIDAAYKMNGGGFQTGGVIDVIDEEAMVQIKKILNFNFLDTDCLKSLYDRIMIKAFDYLKLFIGTSFKAFKLLIIGYDKSTKNVKDDLIVENANVIIDYAEQYAEYLVGQKNETYIEKIGNVFEYLLFHSKISEAVQGVGVVGQGLISIITKIFNLILNTPSLLSKLLVSIKAKAKANEYYELIKNNEVDFNKLYIGSMCAYISYINQDLLNTGLLFSGKIVGQMVTTAWNNNVKIVYFAFMAAVGKLILNIIHQSINNTVVIGADKLTEIVNNLNELLNTSLLNEDTKESIAKLNNALEPFYGRANVAVDFIMEFNYLSQFYLNQLGGISEDEQQQINEVVNQQFNQVIPQINQVVNQQINQVIPQVQALIAENNNNVDNMALGGRASTRKRRKLATSRKKSNRGRKPKTAKKSKTRRRNP